MVHRRPEISAVSAKAIAPGPSTTTSAELKALKTFIRVQNPYAPQFVAWKSEVQGPSGLLPGGYVTYTAMTMMPGDTLFNLQFWGLPEDERHEITRAFLLALQYLDPAYIIHSNE